MRENRTRLLYYIHDTETKNLREKILRDRLLAIIKVICTKELTSEETQLLTQEYGELRYELFLINHEQYNQGLRHRKARLHAKLNLNL